MLLAFEGRELGELSKSIGEDGEALVRNFLGMIGWQDALEAVSIKCLKPHKHGKTDKDRTTHGIDLLYPQKKQLEEFAAEHAIISVKFTRAAYPKSPGTKFKQYITDLAHTVECYKNSERHKDISRSAFSDYHVKSENFSCILFWLSSEKGSDQDVISKLANSQIPPELKFFTIQVIDNRRAAFIYDSIKTTKDLFPNQQFSFNYGLFSENFSDRSIPAFGRSMPSEYLSSSVLPFRINDETGKNVAIVIACDEDFSKDNLLRLIGFARDITQGFASKLVFLFQDFNESANAGDVSDAILSSRDQISDAEVKVYSLRSDFRSLVNAE